MGVVRKGHFHCQLIDSFARWGTLSNLLGCRITSGLVRMGYFRLYDTVVAETYDKLKYLKFPTCFKLGNFVSSFTILSGMYKHVKNLATLQLCLNLS